MASATSCNSVLIVEDDKDIRETLKLVLEMENYRVITAANGKEGVEVLARVEHPCLVLLDLMMPVMNGWEFLAKKRELDQLADIPVVVVSAVGEQAKSAGAAGYIKKPVDIHVLLDTVRQYCGHEPQGEPKLK